MSVSFTKKIPDELYIDSFNNNKVINLEYDGPDVLYVLVDKFSNMFVRILDSSIDNFNYDLFEMVVVDSKIHPDVAYYLTNSNIPDREFETETLIDGTTYQKIINPTLKDFYRVKYDLESKKWIWEVITVDPKSIRNIVAEKYRNYINENIEKVSNDTILKKTATDYLKTLDTFETSGKGSIPSWKIIEAKISDVPMVPAELMAAFNVLP